GVLFIAQVPEGELGYFRAVGIGEVADRVFVAGLQPAQQFVVFGVSHELFSPRWQYKHLVSRKYSMRELTPSIAITTPKSQLAPESRARGSRPSGLPRPAGQS